MKKPPEGAREEMYQFSKNNGDKRGESFYFQKLQISKLDVSVQQIFI